MKKLGIISHISNKGNIIARSNKTPHFGTTVFTQDNKKIGTVYDIFGPTKKPYITVKPIYAKNLKNLENRVGQSIYVSSRPVKKWGRGKRRKK